jgi:uncharacterized membrane protein YfcA
MGSETLLFLLLAITGLAGGFLAGLLGIGGGLIYIAVLPEVCQALGVPSHLITQYTIANSLFATLIGSVAASITHLHRGVIQPKASVIIGLSAISTSICVLYFVVNTPFYSRKIFSGLVCLLLAYMILRGLFSGNLKEESNGSKSDKKKVWKYVLIGMLGGAVSPLSGLGGSILMIPVLRSWMHYDIKTAGVISLGVVFLQSLSSTIVNLRFDALPLPNVESWGLIILPVALILGSTVAVASPIGASTSRRVKSGTLHYYFLATLFLVFAKSMRDFLL